jgi:hypothetical protein
MIERIPELRTMNKILVAIMVAGLLLTTGLTVYFFHSLAQKLPAAEIQKSLMKSTAYLLDTGIIFALLMLVPANIMCINSQKRNRLLLPYLWFIANAFLYGLLQEQIFHFRKQTGLWAGEFSLSFLIVLIYTFIALLIYLLNRLIVLWISKKQISK